MLQDIKTKYNVTLDVEYGSLSKIINWCDKNCIDEWSFNDQEFYPRSTIVENFWNFKFKNEQDCIMFSLKWK